MKNNPLGISDSLRKTFYSYPALISAMPWLDSIPPLPPVGLRVRAEKDAISITWEEAGMPGRAATSFVIYRFEGKKKPNLRNPRHIVGIVHDSTHVFKDHNITLGANYTYVITALDRLHNESAPSKPVSVRLTKHRSSQLEN